MEETSRVLVSAEPILITTNGNQPAGTMNVVVELRHKLRIYEHLHSRAVETNITTRGFSLPLATFASAAAARPAVESVLSELTFRFPRGSTHWCNSSDDVDDAPSVPIDGLRSVAARVSELGAGMLSSLPSRNADAPLAMRVRIRLLTVLTIPQDALINYEPLLLFHQHRNGRDDNRSLADYYVAAVTAEIDEYLGGLAAAEEALETVRYEGDVGDEASQLTCPICISDVAIGCHVTRLPCSHRFHKDCIGKWLKKNSDCPLCRSKL